jgi:hypothetical protein
LFRFDFIEVYSIYSLAFIGNAWMFLYCSLLRDKVENYD